MSDTKQSHVTIDTADSGFYICYKGGRTLAYPHTYGTREAAQRKLDSLGSCGRNMHVVERGGR